MQKSRLKNVAAQTIFTIFFLLFLISCTSSRLALGPAPNGVEHAKKCSIKLPHPLPASAPEALDLFSDLLEAKCYREAIQLGSGIRATFRQKNYSVSTEVLSVFLPETALSEYILESYERAYLSFLMASAYLAMGESDSASVELRKSYSEGKADIYTYGEDPVNILLLAAFWDNIGIAKKDSGLGRPFWMRLAGMIENTNPVYKMAINRMAAIDEGKLLELPWRISALGRMPKLDWSMNFAARSDSGYYKVIPIGSWPSNCRSDSGAILSTSSWMKKIAARYASDYHPLLHLKSWVRLPIGLAYGATTIAAGLGVAAGGCYLTKGEGRPCEEAVKAGGYLISRSGDVVSFTLAPDLRHWNRVPAAVMITSASSDQKEDCWNSLPVSSQAINYPLVGH